MLAPEIMGWGERGRLKTEDLRSILGRETELKEKSQQGGMLEGWGQDQKLGSRKESEGHLPLVTAF